jgi:glycosyltransferase involved in cell wall biosynthesis
MDLFKNPTRTGASLNTLSIIIPFYNEEESLPLLLKDLEPVLAQLPPGTEVLFVDDGSTDKGASVIEHAASQDPHIKLISFKKNLGQTAAWSAGIDYASGGILVFLDADRQNDPRDIPLLVEKITRENYDVVSGWRKDRQDPFWNRRLPSILANKLISWVTGVRLHDYGCSLKAYRADLIRNIRLYGEMHRFLPAYAGVEGARILEIPVRHHPRRLGKSKYGLGRTFKVMLDLMTVKFLGGFSTKPLYAFGSLAGVSLMLGLGTFSIVAYRVLVLQRKEATPMIFLMVVFFIAALQFIMMGLLAELIVRTYHEAQSKTIYRVRSLKNLEPLRPRRGLLRGS